MVHKVQRIICVECRAEELHCTCMDKEGGGVARPITKLKNMRRIVRDNKPYRQLPGTVVLHVYHTFLTVGLQN